MVLPFCERRVFGDSDDFAASAPDRIGSVPFEWAGRLCYPTVAQMSDRMSNETSKRGKHACSTMQLENQCHWSSGHADFKARIPNSKRLRA